MWNFYLGGLAAATGTAIASWLQSQTPLTQRALIQGAVANLLWFLFLPVFIWDCWDDRQDRRDAGGTQ